MTEKKTTDDTPNLCKLAEYIQTRRNPEKVTAALIACIVKSGQPDARNQNPLILNPLIFEQVEVRSLCELNSHRWGSV